MHCIIPLGYIDFLSLVLHAKIILTDSGSLQQETTVLNIPCLTLRDTTERPITIKQGTNVLVGSDTMKIEDIALDVLKNGIKRGKLPKYWDGKTADRIVNILNVSFSSD